MSKFNLIREVTYIQYYKDVEADTLEEAKHKVRNDLDYSYEDLAEAYIYEDLVKGVTDE